MCSLQAPRLGLVGSQLCVSVSVTGLSQFPPPAPSPLPGDQLTVPSGLKSDVCLSFGPVASKNSEYSRSSPLRVPETFVLWLLILGALSLQCRTLALRPLGSGVTGCLAKFHSVQRVGSLGPVLPDEGWAGKGRKSHGQQGEWQPPSFLKHFPKHFPDWELLPATAPTTAMGQRQGAPLC